MSARVAGWAAGKVTGGSVPMPPIPRAAGQGFQGGRMLDSVREASSLAVCITQTETTPNLKQANLSEKNY